MFSTRTASPADHAAFVRFFHTFDIPDEVPDLAWWERWCSHACFVEENGVSLGYGLAYELGSLGIVMHCAVDPSARRRGVGRAVMEALAMRLRDKQCTRWMLNVKERNAPAIALYRGLGLQVDHRLVSLSLSWDAVNALPQGTAACEAFDQAEDAAIEDAFAIDRGRLQLHRGLGDRVLLRAREGGTTRGVISFEPAFPGAGLFRARSSADAQALLESVRPAARHDHLRVVIENDDALSRALTAVGATPVSEMLRMSGPIPSPDR